MGSPSPRCWLASRRSCFEHGDQGGTFNGSPLMAAVGCAVVETVRAPAFLEAVTTNGAYLIDRLRSLSADLGHGEVRGRGLLVALQLRQHDAAKVSRSCMDRGLLINAPRPDTLRFMPALNVSRAEIDEMLSRLRITLESMS